ncbi:MAG: hypothetical protein JO316_19755, partial [Abitibacteriaceae bacterium]|nr:hypothetical protein [Abditibacteriaceae bacterium]
ISDRPGYLLSRYSDGRRGLAPLGTVHVAPAEGVTDPFADWPPPHGGGYTGPPPPGPVALSDKAFVALESRPGDVVVFNHNLQHASFGGSSQRRMFTLNLCRRAQNPVELYELREFINSAARFWVEQTHSDVMRRTASPERMRHLEQVMENEDELPALVRQAKAVMAEPARG